MRGIPLYFYCSYSKSFRLPGCMLGLSPSSSGAESQAPLPVADQTAEAKSEAIEHLLASRHFSKAPLLSAFLR